MNARRSTSRGLDRWDGLMLMLATVVAILGLALLPEPVQLPLLPPLPAIDIPPPPVIDPIGPTARVGDVPEPIPILADDLPDSANSEDLKWCLGISIAFVATWTPALWIIRMRRPRPRWRRSIRQPGLAATSVGLLVLAIVFAADLLRWSASWVSHSGGLPTLQEAWFAIRNACDAGLEGTVHAVPATWLIMILGGWWRPERSGIDRLGRALGVGWIVLMAAEFAQSFLD